MTTEKVIEGLALGVIGTLTAAVLFLIATGCGPADWDDIPDRETCTAVVDGDCVTVECSTLVETLCGVPEECETCTAIALDDGVAMFCNDGTEAFFEWSP